jgi:DNA-binding CsgD family transcriptional regulator
MSNQLAGSSSAPPSIEQLLLELHAAVGTVPPATFQAWALGHIGRVIAHSAAAWGIGPTETRQIGVVATTSSLAEASGDPAAASLWAVGADEHEVSDRVLHQSEVDRSRGLTHVIRMSREAHEPAFSEQEREVLFALTPHLHVAWRTCQLIELLSRGAGARGRAAAIVDREGYVHVADVSFASMLRRAWPQWSGFRVPAALSGLLTAGGSLEAGGIEWTAEVLGRRLCLSGLRLGAQARLTARERSIASAICEGLSYAEAAQRFGISTNTLRNSVVRVYRKLGVGNRVELLRCLESPVSPPTRIDDSAGTRVPALRVTTRSHSARCTPAKPLFA